MKSVIFSKIIKSESYTILGIGPVKVTEEFYYDLMDPIKTIIMETSDKLREREQWKA